MRLGSDLEVTVDRVSRARDSATVEIDVIGAVEKMGTRCREEDEGVTQGDPALGVSLAFDAWLEGGKLLLCNGEICFTNRFAKLPTNAALDRKGTPVCLFVKYLLYDELYS